MGVKMSGSSLLGMLLVAVLVLGSVSSFSLQQRAGLEPRLLPLLGHPGVGLGSQQRSTLNNGSARTYRHAKKRGAFDQLIAKLSAMSGNRESFRSPTPVRFGPGKK